MTSLRITLLVALALLGACGASNQLKGDVTETVEGAGESAGGAVDDVKETVEGAGESASGAVDDVKEGVSDLTVGGEGEAE
jgi:uncharacterized protein YjbJ (UPF0337 family)